MTSDTLDAAVRRIVRSELATLAGGREPARERTPRKAQKRERGDGGNSLMGKVFEKIQNGEGNPTAIAKALRAEATKVRGAVAGLLRAGKVERAGRGQYAAL